ncbi:hypothetical protein ILYODFUR_026340 [Ilyodon furcidens]|uniref:Uncharacterized protein n=1 Tax=Ilyodon furcidens TaxID=33524 RepID=A0ABV0TLU3_9TELE
MHEHAVQHAQTHTTRRHFSVVSVTEAVSAGTLCWRAATFRVEGLCIALAPERSPSYSTEHMDGSFPQPQAQRGQLKLDELKKKTQTHNVRVFVQVWLRTDIT